MSYQLIHTSAPNLLDSALSGYGTVACTQGMPRILRRRVTALSNFREPDFPVVSGAQYSYRILESGGEQYHVLTCAQMAGADYTGRACHIAHHLLLTRAEVLELLGNELGPTPAGIMLALQNKGFWRKCWSGPPAYLSGEPELSLQDLPDATAQPTWKKITGHKSNAKAFFTPPYERDCLVIVPKGIASTSILHLFHESDWLTPTHGWGVTFTTCGDETDTFAETCRITVGEACPWVQRAARQKRPALHIGPEMQLSVGGASPGLPPASSAMEPPLPKAETPPVQKILQDHGLHYSYIEETDEEIYGYESAPGQHPLRLMLGGGFAVLLVLGIAAGVHEIIDYALPPAQMTEEIAQENQTAVLQSALNALENLAASQEEWHASRVQLQKLALEIGSVSPQKPGDKTAALKELLSILTISGELTASEHTQYLRRLCAYGRMLEISEGRLVRFYLLQVSHGKDRQELLPALTQEEKELWAKLMEQEPVVLSELHKPPFSHYTATLLPPTPETTLLSSTEAEKTAATEQNAVPLPPRIALLPQPVLAGDVLPEKLQQLLLQAPCQVNYGEWVRADFAPNGTILPPQRTTLQAPGCVLHILPGEKKGTYILRLSTTANGEDMGDVLLTERGGRLISATCRSAPVIIGFPVPETEQYLSPVLLVPRFGFPITADKPADLPKVDSSIFAIKSTQLSIRQKGKRCQLLLEVPKVYPWTELEQHRKIGKLQVQLPGLGGHNSLAEAPVDKETNPRIAWNSKLLTETETETTFECSLEAKLPPGEQLMRVFHTVANTSCCGEVPEGNATYSLANLYRICMELDNTELSRKERQKLQSEYCELFNNKVFCNILQQIFRKEPALTLSYEMAISDKWQARKARRQLGEILQVPETRRLIRQRICEVLSRSLSKAYAHETERYRTRNKRTLILMLKQLHVGEHGDLVWLFQLQTKQKGS